MIIFCLSLLGGQLVRITPVPGVTVYPHDIVLFLYVVSHAKALFSSIVRGGNDPIQLSLSFFVFSMLLSLVVNLPQHTVGQQIEGVLYLARFILYALVYFCVAGQPYTRGVLLYLYGTGVAFAVLGIIQYGLYPNLRNLSYLGWDPHYYRLFSTFLDPNFAGLFILLTLIMGWYIKAYYRFRFMVWVQVFLVGALILTLSRSTYLAAIGSGVGYMLFGKTWKPLFALLACVAIVLFAPIPNREITPILRWETGQARITNWQENILMVGKAPVFGVGFNLLGSDRVNTYTPLPSHARAGVDNSFLFVLRTTGIVGAAAYIYLLVAMVRLGEVLCRQKKLIVLGQTYLLSLLAIFIHSMFINSFFYPWILLWLWMFTGVLRQIYLKSRKSEK